MRIKCDVCGDKHEHDDDKCPLLYMIGEGTVAGPTPEEWNRSLERAILDQPVQLVDGVLRPVPWEGETQLLRDGEVIATIKPIKTMPPLEDFLLPPRTPERMLEAGRLRAAGIRRVIISPDGTEEPVADDAPWVVKGQPVFLASGMTTRMTGAWFQRTRWQRFLIALGDGATSFAAWCYRRAGKW